MSEPQGGDPTNAWSHGGTTGRDSHASDRRHLEADPGVASPCALLCLVAVPAQTSPTELPTWRVQCGSPMRV
jgi:hypothetical protein